MARRTGSREQRWAGAGAVAWWHLRLQLIARPPLRLRLLLLPLLLLLGLVGVEDDDGEDGGEVEQHEREEDQARAGAARLPLPHSHKADVALRARRAGVVCVWRRRGAGGE